jgi:hypothetical protein
MLPPLMLQDPIKQSVMEGKFHRPKNQDPYHKPKKLNQTLLDLFNHRPVLSTEQAHERLCNMRDPDGSLMFCWTKRGSVNKFAKTSQEYKDWAGCPMCGKKPCTGCNGKRLSVAEVKTHFSSLSQKRKKQMTA